MKSHGKIPFLFLVLYATAVILPNPAFAFDFDDLLPDLKDYKTILGTGGSIFASSKMGKKYPGITTLLSTGNPIGTSIASSLGKFNHTASPMDGIFSGASIMDPFGYHASNFLSGESGESVTFGGLWNYNNRLGVGSAMGAAYGASAGYSYGPWATLGGAATGAIMGGYMGTLRPDQADEITNKFSFENSDWAHQIGLDKFARNSPVNIAPSFGSDMNNVNKASWEIGHEGNYFGDGIKEFGTDMAGTWALKGTEPLWGPYADQGKEYLKEFGKSILEKF